MPATTLPTLRQALGRALDDIEIHAATSATSSTVVLGSAINATSGASNQRYNQRHVYCSSGVGAGQQRRVQTNGFAPSTGTLTIYFPWSINPAGGNIIELTGLFPCQSAGQGDQTDYLTIINRALSKMLYPDRITVAITTAESYSLSTYAHWLNRSSRLVRVYEPSPTGSRIVPADWRNPRLVADAGTITLELDAPFSTASGSLTLEVLRPANTLISNVEVTTGFTIDTQTALPSVEEFLPFGIMEATAILMRRKAEEAAGRPWAAMHADAKAEAQASPFWDHTQARVAAPTEEAA